MLKWTRLAKNIYITHTVCYFDVIFLCFPDLKQELYLSNILIHFELNIKQVSIFYGINYKFYSQWSMNRKIQKYIEFVELKIEIE